MITRFARPQWAAVSVTTAAVVAAGTFALVGHSHSTHIPTIVKGEKIFANTVRTVPGGNVSIGPQAMNGDVKANPGDQLQVGYDFTMPGKHAATTVYFSNASVVFSATCDKAKKGSPSTDITVPIPDSRPGYSVSANDNSWKPSGDQNSPLTYQGHLTVPNICGGTVSLKNGGTFTAFVQSKDTADKINVRWHYTDAGKGGGWSATASILAAYPTGTFSIKGDQPNLLVGATNAVLPLTITNPNPFPIEVDAVSANVIDTPPGCSAGSLVITSFTAPPSTGIIVNGDSDSTALSLPIAFPDSTTANQGSCIGHPTTFKYMGSGQVAGP